MPIATRALTKLANREDLGPGHKRWRVDGENLRGRPWKHGSFGGTLAEAEVIRDAITAESLGMAETDLAELLEFVQLGDPNTVAAFDYTDRDIVQADGEEHIFKWFAEAEGAEAITVAWWLESINTGTFNSIRNRIVYTGTQGADITSRFTFMGLAEPWYDLTVEAP